MKKYFKLILFLMILLFNINVKADQQEMFIETMFPSAETLNRCGVMKDFGDGKTAVTTMWGNIQ